MNNKIKNFIAKIYLKSFKMCDDSWQYCTKTDVILWIIPNTCFQSMGNVGSTLHPLRGPQNPSSLPMQYVSK